MADKLKEIADSINSRLSNKDTKVLEVEQLEGGQYRLTVQLDSEFIERASTPVVKTPGNKPVPLFLTRDRRPAPGSLLEKLEINNEYNSLKKRLEVARLKTEIKETANLNTKYRDRLDDSYLDIRNKSAIETQAIELYKRSSDEYFKTGIYGTSLDLLSNFAATGFYNEINNPEIKEFFDSWVRDVKFIETVTKIFHDLFKYSVCYPLTAYGKYEPHEDGISSIPGREPNESSKSGIKAAVGRVLAELVKKETGKEMDYKRFAEIYSQKEKGATSSNKIPLAYSLLDPQYIKVSSSGFFGAQTVSILPKGLQNLKSTLKRQTDGKTSKQENELLKYIPNELKAAAQNNTEYVFKPEELSVIYLRKPDPDIYAKPRGARAFDAFDFKDELKKADYATLDGIYNYILKVTVGEKDNPVTDPETLASIAEAFNTPQKAFTVVWNHTLNIEKITTNEVGAILGKQKYEPVDADITAALGITRALIDGGQLSNDAATLAAKAIQSEISAARKQVESWIYEQYKEIAKQAGFTSYPFVRWKESVVSTDSDAVTRASLMQLLDRKSISIQTLMRELNFDYETEVQRMKEEFPLIQQGILRAGSPFQVSGDSGRPKGQPTGDNAPQDNIKITQRQTKVEAPTQQASYEESLTMFLEQLASLPPEEKISIAKLLEDSAKKEPEDTN